MQITNYYEPMKSFAIKSEKYSIIVRSCCMAYLLPFTQAFTSFWVASLSNLPFCQFTSG